MSSVRRVAYWPGTKVSYSALRRRFACEQSMDPNLHSPSKIKISFWTIENSHVINRRIVSWSLAWETIQQSENTSDSFYQWRPQLAKSLFFSTPIVQLPLEQLENGSRFANISLVAFVWSKVTESTMGSSTYPRWVAGRSLAETTSVNHSLFSLGACRSDFQTCWS